MLTQDVLPARGVRHFRLGTLLAMAAPLAASVLVGGLPVADAVGLAFAVSASSFCPLLVLGIWWRRLTPPGAAAGMLVGGGSALARGRRRRWPASPGRRGRALHALLAWPALWSVPLGSLTMVLVSLATPGRVPARRGRRSWPASTSPRTAAHGGDGVSGFLAGLCVAALPLLAAGFWLGRRTARTGEPRAGSAAPVEHATFQTLHTASLAAPPLRAGLTEETARRSGPPAALPARHGRAVPRRRRESPTRVELPPVDLSTGGGDAALQGRAAASVRGSAAWARKPPRTRTCRTATARTPLPRTGDFRHGLQGLDSLRQRHHHDVGPAKRRHHPELTAMSGLHRVPAEPRRQHPVVRRRRPARWTWPRMTGRASLSSRRSSSTESCRAIPANRSWP
ncbi:hypothetical protein SGLAM104S_01723 [Streptomyces glaucescens]